MLASHPEGLPAQPFTVFGCWRETRERYGEYYGAVDARSAEILAQIDARAKGGTLWVCRVVPGNVPAVDGYTAFVNPSDDRNAGVEGLVPDVPDFAAGDPEWTVFGIAVPRGTADGAIGWTGERCGDVVNATSAGAAEDVARSRIADKGGELWVCSVLAGRVIAADSYALFVDPDVKAAPGSF